MFAAVGCLPLSAPSNKGTIVMALSKNCFISLLLHCVSARVGGSQSHHAPPSIPCIIHILFGYTAPSFIACKHKGHIQHVRCVAMTTTLKHNRGTLLIVKGHYVLVTCVENKLKVGQCTSNAQWLMHGYTYNTLTTNWCACDHNAHLASCFPHNVCMCLQKVHGLWLIHLPNKIDDSLHSSVCTLYASILHMDFKGIRQL